MILYLFKLILILVFNIGVNIYCINSECKCCCGNNKFGEIGGGSKGNLSTNPPEGLNPKPVDHNEEKRSGNNGNLGPNPAKDTNQISGTNSLNTAHGSKGGGKPVDKIEIDLDNHILECNENTLQGFEKIDVSTSINPPMVIHGDFKNNEDIYYTIDENIFNSIKEDSNVEIIKTSDSDNYIVFAVKTQVNGLDEGNQKYDYYLVYCHNCNTSINNNGLFDSIDTNVEIKILGSGNNLTNISYMFYCCINLEKIIFTIKGLNNSKVTNMEGMFKGCEKLEELDLSKFNTNNVTNMSHMFDGCSSLAELDLSKFNTNNVTNMSHMFVDCGLLTKLNLSNFNNNNVTNMSHMFSGCSSLKELVLTNFKTNNVTDMGNMFEDCKLLTSLNLSNFNTSKVTNMKDMFSGCNSLKFLNVSNFNTEKVTDMQYMFYGCSSLNNLDLSKFNTSNVTDMVCMFAGCTNLTRLSLPDKVIYYDEKTNSYKNMFCGCEKLSREKVTTNDTKIYNMF